MFKKGDIGYWTGKKRPPPSKETREKIGNSHKGRKVSAEGKANMSKAQKGKIISIESRIKMSQAHLGKKHPHTLEWNKNISDSLMGNKNRSWKGGVFKNREGYILEKCHDHPNRNSASYVLQHRIVMEKHIGRFLYPKEVVHHINGIRDDNRIENLMLLANKSEHSKLHFPNGIKKTFT